MTDQVIQHSGRGHSELGPSSSERWLKCTPSAVLSAQFQDKPSVYAEEGTFLHELCELKLHRYLGDMTKDVIERQYAEHRDNDFYSDEAEEVTDVYVNHCIEVIEAIRLSCPDPYIAVEHRLDFSEYIAQMIINDGLEGGIHRLRLRHGFEIGILVNDDDKLLGKRV